VIAGHGKLLTANQSARFAILDSMDREQVIEMIVRGLQSADRVCEMHKFGGSSPDGLWYLLNGVQPYSKRWPRRA
jgi:hypothetical protein